MIEIKAPTLLDINCKDYKTLFLAGSITNAINWQEYIVDQLKDQKIIIFNPRRDDFDVNNVKLERKQIEWEHQNLLRASAILFWFSNETLAPITLFELGKELGRYNMGKGQFRNKLFVGCHPEYKRLRDVKIQCALEDRSIQVTDSLDNLVKQVISYFK